MTSEFFGTPKMIVLYEWSFASVEEQPATIASKLILFRGEKVFRVGLKNHTLEPVLFLMVIDLRKIGMKVESVTYGIQGSDIGPAQTMQMTIQDLGYEGNLQLFTMTYLKKFVGKRTFVFRICIEGADSGFSYQLCDRLAKDQLGAALKSQQNLADVEFVVKDKSYPAHKAILAARSPVFADEFEKKQPGKDGPHQIRIEGVEPSTLEKFLHFIYTGESIGTLADEELLQLADQYQLTTLTRLCKVALKKMDSMQMANLRKRLNSNPEELPSSKIMPEKETEIFFDRTTPTFRCTSLFKKSENGQSKCVMQYQNDNFLIAYFIEEIQSLDSQVNQDVNSKPVIHFTCDKHRSFGLQVEDVYCGMQGPRGYREWLKMEPKHFQKNAELLHFTVQALLDFSQGKPILNQFRIYFDTKTVSTIGNYYYEMMDDKWTTDLWLAATNQKLTDVEIFVGTVKVMEAHRIILSARSPVLNEFLNKISNTKKSIVTFGVEFDVEVVKHFLNFLYTGSLKTSAKVKKMSKLATIYQVETLKNVCQLINRVPDIEELSDCLIQL